MPAAFAMADVFRIQYLDSHSLVQLYDGRFFLFIYDSPTSGRLVNYHWWEPSKEKH